MNSVNITLDPTYVNVSKNPMVFVVSGSNIDEFQYQYVLDVRTFPDNTLRTRIKQFANPSGVAIFDVAHVVDEYINPQTDYLTITEIDNLLADGEFQQFRITAGEEYGTSPSSSVTLYDGSGGIGVPNVTGSNVINGVYTAFAGALDITPGISTGAGGGWNFGDYFDINSGQYMMTSLPSSTYKASALNHKMGRNDYALLPVFDAQTDISNNNTVVQLYNSSNSIIASTTLGRSSAGRYLNYLPVGTQNMIDGGFFTQAQVNQAAWMRVRNTATTAIDKCYTIEPCTNNYERRNFLFVNKWGLWENYGMNLPIRRNTNITRDEITKTNIPWSSLTGTNSYDRRGKEAYNQSFDDRYQITTPFITGDEAQLVTELIESPQVFLQYNTLDMGLGVQLSKTFIPVNIMNSSYTAKTNNLQKAFQYNIEYKLSNDRPNN